MKLLSFSNNDTIPTLGLGTWKSAPGEVGEAIYQAIKLGFRHIDCAKIYGNEKEIGIALKRVIEEKIASRSELFITSKLWNNSHKEEDVLPALKQTLSDLQLDYLDLYLIHWPVAHKKEVVSPKSAADFLSLKEVPILTTWKSMMTAKKQGFAKHVGVSNFSVSKLQHLIAESELVPEMNQVESHPYLQQNELLDFCQKNKILFTAYWPLGSRDLSVANKLDLFADETIQQIAKKHNCSPAQIILAWAVQRNTIAIPKTININRMTENLVASNIELSVDDMQNIAKLDRNHRFIDGNFWVIEGNGYSLEGLWG